MGSNSLSSNNPYHNIGYSVGNTFEPGYFQQAPLETSQYSTRPTHRPLPTTDHQSYRTGLSQETAVKIEELKRLMNRYHRYHQNPDAIVKWAIYCSSNGDNKFLDEKLEQLHSIDSLANRYIPQNILA